MLSNQKYVDLKKDAYYEVRFKNKDVEDNHFIVKATSNEYVKVLFQNGSYRKDGREGTIHQAFCVQEITKEEAFNNGRFKVKLDETY